MAKIELKKPVVDEIKEIASDATAAVLVDYRGLTVEQDTVLRKKFREAGVVYKVYKNTMLHIAFEGTDFAQLDPNLEGPTAVERIIKEFAKDSPAIEFKAGVVEGTYYDAEGINVIADIPSRDVLISKLLGSLQSPITNFARVLNQIAEKGEAAE